MTSFKVESDNTVYDSREDCNAIIETATNTLVIGCNKTIIPNSVTSIGNSAFGGCSGLTSITIPNSVTSIGISAFENCPHLTSVTIPNSVTYIGEAAFRECGSLTSVTIGNGVTSIRDNTFSYCSLTSVTIPNSVTSIGYSAFFHCWGLTAVTIPNSVTSIEGYAFSGSGLTSVTIPNSVTLIHGHAFYYCSDLTSVTIGNGVTSIGEYTFGSCYRLKSITIGNGLTSIAMYAFHECKALTSFICNAITPPACRYASLWSTSTCILYVPTESVEAYKSASEWENFVNIKALTSKLTYIVDGEVYKSYDVKMGTTITPEAEPTKEGYTFSGWSEIPETMPADDVTITGNFTLIDDIEDITANDSEYQIFTIDGTPVETLQEGVNIIKYKNGTSKKVVVK